MSEAAQYDPYALSVDDIQEPPTSLWQALRKIGPGIILAGSIVGSGELILTTWLGAKYGFAFLWLVVYSCIIKVFVQIELGRYAISSGKPTLAALDSLPGPRWRSHWLVWWWFFMLLATVSQLGGMIGGVQQALDLTRPGVAPWMWGVFIAGSVIVLLLSGGYLMIERLTTVLVVGVTAFTVLGAVALQFTDLAVGWREMVVGLIPTLPQDNEAANLAFTCFGITGVGANELYYYPYWCVEKGYARWTGPRTNDEAWERRAKGWMRVLQLDAWVSMVVFTAATLAFYFLGAGVLHAQGKVPEKQEMINVLSHLYEPSFGAWTVPAFLIGAWAVLFKTLYVSSAGHSRLTADFFGLAKFVNLPDSDSRRAWIRGLCVFYPLLALALFLVFGANPQAMMMFGAMVQAATLPIICGAALYLRYRYTDRRIAPNRLSDAFLIFAVLSITAVALYATPKAMVDWIDKLKPPAATAPTK